MVEPIAFLRARAKFACGDDIYTNLMVVNFTGPGGIEASAYCCNVNIDIDGEPQAYGPADNPRIKPKERLRNGGFRSPEQNQAMKDTYEAAKKTVQDLEQKKADIIAKSKPSDDPAKPTVPPPDPAAMAKLDKEIEKATNAMKKAAIFWYAKERPKYFGEKFWHWYGPFSMTPEDADKAKPFLEPDSAAKLLRRPQLDNVHKPELEDAFGRYPVIQSDFEPGPGYYVGAFPLRANRAFPDWDQRSYLPPDSRDQVPNAAISTKLEGVTSLRLFDQVLGMRLDTGATLTMPFLDHGLEYKVGECSIRAFEGLGGILAADANMSNNDFIVLYLAFAHSATQSTDSMLMRFAAAPNADDFPVMLAFIAQATLDAKARGVAKVAADPVTNFQHWKASQGTRSPGILPAAFTAVDQALSKSGFSPFAQRVLRRHPSLLSGGPWLKPP
jgi:hypothetical protein